MKHILIVDDAATVRMYYRDTLEGAGYDVDEAVNGMEALERAVARTYDLYLVDVNMPILDGYSFVREMRSRAELAQAPAVMISTESQVQDAAKAYAAGANLYLFKPVATDTLLRYVGLLLGEPLR
jgi:two-component system chemotaxis response regulator CheY